MMLACLLAIVPATAANDRTRKKASLARSDPTRPSSPTNLSVRARTTELSLSSPFVIRNGQQLLLNGARYRFLGFNVWRANVASWNHPPNTSYDVNDGTTLDTTLKDINGNGGKMNVIRVWFFQQFAVQSGAYNWAAFNKTLQVAYANGFKVIATLADQWNYEGPPFKDPRWYQSGYANTVESPYEIVPYRRYVRDVVSRYKDNPTILAWELVNEPEVAVSQTRDSTCAANAGQILEAFTHDVGGLMKSIDRNHLVSLGAAGNGNCGTIEGDYQRVMSDPSIDLCSFHDYYGATNATAYNAYNGLNMRIKQCAALNKAIYVGEMGIHFNASPCNGSLTCRASYLNRKLAAAFGMQGTVGYVPWQFDDRGYISDDYVYGPRDPGLTTLSGYALP
jgi:mannan endo-1,4-beta-mannosidase